MKEEELHKNKTVPEMGVDTSHVFSGNVKGEALKRVYGESAQLFADLIKKYLPASEKGYTLADLGSYKGELLAKILEELGVDYKVKTIAVDVNEEALKQNTADESVVSSVDSIPLADGSVDISIMRYVLQWNPLNVQKDILKEFNRITRKIGVLQHCCPDDQNADEWRKHTDDIYDGEEVLKLKREGYYFSSPGEVEAMMTELGIKFKKICEVTAPGFSEIFVERYALSREEAETLRKILGKFDYENVVTWVILPEAIE
jgi:ubiquinone/menaquinone biosynthesis C-methylase UbiE